MDRLLGIDLPNHLGERVTVQGYLHTLRRLGKVNFLILRDRTRLIQAVVDASGIAQLEGLQVETVLSVSGVVVAAPSVALGVELQDVSIEVITPVTEVLPFELNKPQLSASLPVFLEHATIGHRHLQQRSILRIAAGVVAGFRKTLDAQGFTEIYSPKIVASATESGANVFKIDYFGQTAYLAQSPQFYKQIMVGVFERVYEVAPVFRAEPFDTSRHTNEFMSLDVEFGFIKDHTTVMHLLTDVVRGIIQHLHDHYQEELKLLGAVLPEVGETIPSIYYPDAQEVILRRTGIDVRGEPDLAPEHERILGQWAKEEFGSDFLFVPGYPMVKRPFYTHPNPTDNRFSNSFDLLFRGLELVTGGQRLHRYEEYIAAAKRIGYALEPYKEYFECFQYGMPPHGGFAIGLERFVTQLLQLDNVKWATLFPRDLSRLKP